MSSDPPKEKATFKRWYDHDPLLVEVLEVLRSFEDELRAQSQQFLDKITEQVGEEAVERFYSKVLEERGDLIIGRRWYDQDPVVSKAVELLRIVPPEVQRKAAENFFERPEGTGCKPAVHQP